ncbi:MAG: hypothetical protein EBU46_12210 [Nitrosomonadaceae bacterium]|nr:hypothetical protein [Nitrosomonadaceae bacterium]
MGHFATAEEQGFFDAVIEDANIQVRPVFKDTEAYCADLAGNICGMDTFIPSLRVGSRIRFFRRGVTKLVSLKPAPSKAKQRPQKQKLAPLNRNTLMRAIAQMGDKTMAATV